MIHRVFVRILNSLNLLHHVPGFVKARDYSDHASRMESDTEYGKMSRLLRDHLGRDDTLMDSLDMRKNFVLDVVLDEFHHIYCTVYDVGYVDIPTNTGNRRVKPPARFRFFVRRGAVVSADERATSNLIEGVKPTFTRYYSHY